MSHQADQPDTQIMPVDRLGLIAILSLPVLLGGTVYGGFRVASASGAPGGVALALGLGLLALVLGVLLMVWRIGRPNPAAFAQPVEVPAEEPFRVTLEDRVFERPWSTCLHPSDFAGLTEWLPQAHMWLRDEIATLTADDWARLPEGDPREQAVFDALNVRLDQLAAQAVDFIPSWEMVALVHLGVDLSKQLRRDGAEMHRDGVPRVLQ